MRRQWEMPQAVVEQFAPSEYIAACGTINRVYYFDCDAGVLNPGTAQETIVQGYLIKETNGIEGLQDGSEGYDEFLSTNTFNACGEKCEAKTTDIFLDGYYVPTEYVTGTKTDYVVSDMSKVLPVVIWTGTSGTQGHATTKLNMSAWETAKS